MRRPTPEFVHDWDVQLGGSFSATRIMLAQNTTDLSGRQIGSYELEKLLKRRDATDLYEARDVKLDQPALVEILRATVEEDPELAGRFQRRMETVAQLKHPYIGSVIEVSVSADGYPYAVLEYIDGQWMDDVLAAERAHSTAVPPARDALAFGRTIAEAVSIGHAAGLIHHDLRPDNILIRDADAMPVLIDLGVPIVAPARSANLSDSRADMLDYASPEELDGKSISRRSNIYSTGIILYELLTGHRPQLPTSSWDIFEHSTMPKEVPLEEAREGLSGETYRLVRNCLWRQEWSRFETADEVISAIDTAILAEETVPKTAMWADDRRRWLYVGVPLLALLVLVVGLALAWSQFASAGEQPPATLPAVAAITDTPPQVAAVVEDPDSTATATTEPTPTLTRAAPPTSAMDTTVPVYGPGADQTFEQGDLISFAWIWLTQLKEGESFSVLVQSEDMPGEPIVAGTVSVPDNATLYRFEAAAAELGLDSGAYLWQVRLNSATGAETAVESDPRRFFVAEPPTATPSATAVPPTLTQTATATLTPLPPTPTTAPPTAVACVPRQPAGWVSYRIQPGDIISVFAARSNIPVETILANNCLTRFSVLSVGQLIYIPAPPATATFTPAPTPSPAPATVGPPPDGGSGIEPPPTGGGGGNGGGSNPDPTRPSEGPTSTPKPPDG